MLIGINGKSKSGKDTLADMSLQQRYGCKIALADELKRTCRKFYPAMTVAHLWGPSEMRNKPLPEYPRDHGPFISGICGCCGWDINKADSSMPLEGPQCYLTTRHALQQLGTEWARNCFKDTNVDIVIRSYDVLSRNDSWRYEAELGLLQTNYLANHYKLVLVPDVRFKNEMEAIKNAGGKLWRIKRLGSGLKGAAGKHSSEMEQEEVSDDFFDMVFYNESTLEALQMRLEKTLETL